MSTIPTSEFKIGLSLEKWTLIEERRIGRAKGWLCRCICGNETVLPSYRIGRLSKGCRMCSIKVRGLNTKRLEVGEIFNSWKILSVAEDAKSPDLKRFWVECIGCNVKFNQLERRLLNQAATCIECSKKARTNI